MLSCNKKNRSNRQFYSLTCNTKTGVNYKKKKDWYDIVHIVHIVHLKNEKRYNTIITLITINK